MNARIQKPFILAILLGFSLLLVRCGGPKTAQNNSDTPIAEVSYEKHIKPIVRSYCTTCHSGGNPSAGTSLTSYKEVRFQAEKGYLLERINSHGSPMPPTGLMPAANRETFKKWVKNDYLEFNRPDSSDGASASPEKPAYEFTPPVIEAVDISKGSFPFLDQMQGHWVGRMNILKQTMPWFAFDYRPISESHIHGIFEGGTMGNLFTSFFIADYKGTRTLMARNGGILNGIYRTSYFLLDKMKVSKESSYYRLVDAYGGKQIMWMELTFRGDQLQFNSYTSRFGSTYPSRHMRFSAKRKHPQLAASAAKKLNYPSLKPAYRFPKGLPTPDWGKSLPPTSASFLWQDLSKPMDSLGMLAGDPIRIDQVPYISSLTLKLSRSQAIRDRKLQVYLSTESLTDSSGRFKTRYGFIDETSMNTVVLFPELGKKEETFTLTYLHPGTYYITVIADMNGDGIPSKGDISRKSKKVVVAPRSSGVIDLAGADYKN